MRESDRSPRWENGLVAGLVGLVTRLVVGELDGTREREKFVGFHDLLKILKDPVCPVCFIIHRSILEYLSMAFIEELTMPEFREPIRKGLGYCEKHSAYVRLTARKRLSRMGVAIVLEDLLALIQEQIQTLHEIPDTVACPLCSLQADIETYALSLLADYSHDAEFQSHYENAAGVCLPHLGSILALAGIEGRRYLVEAHIRKLERQIGTLDAYIRKNASRLSPKEMTDAESVSWRSAVNSVVGDPLGGKRDR